MQLQHEQGAGVGPYGNEGGMAQGHLAAIPNEQLDAQRGKDGESNHIGYGEEVTAGILRDDVKNTEKKENHLSPHELRLPPDMFLPVILMVNPAGAMPHKSSFYQYSPQLFMSLRDTINHEKAPSPFPEGGFSPLPRLGEG
jgi:hypothetical protein